LLKVGGIQINPGEDTEWLRQGLQAEFYWKKQGANIAGKRPRPEKTRPFSDIVESLCYGTLYFRRGASNEDAKSAGIVEDYEGFLGTNNAMVI
ncbi:MAG: hypothetical protein ACRC1W_09420, partial [Shewanella sp.]